MIQKNLKSILINTVIVLTIFFIDRASKIYILNIEEIKGVVDVYINPYLNFYLIWNNGIAFGFLSFDQSAAYNFITLIIAVITFVILLMICRSSGKNLYFLIFILGGSFGNLFDRIYYSAVPDFIDFHISDFHWFIFNVADIFITMGVLCLILDEIFFNKRVKNEIK